MIPEKLKVFLESQKVRYKVILHPEKYTAQEIAAAEHITGKEVAKTVIVKAGDRRFIVVLPSNCSIDLLKLANCLNVPDIAIDHEKDFAQLFPDCELGAMPPFGRLYNLPCYVDPSMFEKPEICFNCRRSLKRGQRLSCGSGSGQSSG